MAKTWVCPFWKWEERLTVYCEGAKTEFRTPGARTAYIDRFCANIPGWEQCPLAAELSKCFE